MEKAKKHGWKYAGHLILSSKMYLALYRKHHDKRFYIYIDRETNQVFGHKDPENHPCSMFVGSI